MIREVYSTRTLEGCRLLVAEDADEAASLAASIVEATLSEAASPVLGVATGATPLLTYEMLVRRGLSSHDLRLVLLDEYIGLAPNDERGFAATIQRQLASPLGISPDRVHAPPVSRTLTSARCEGFEREVRILDGVDLQILGIGQNGHIAFNEPGSAFDSRTRAVLLSPLTKQNNCSMFGGSDDVPERACTQGIGTILEARRLLLLATGAQKAAILARALFGSIDPAVPASAIRLHPDVVVVADTEAARLLPATA